jgi:hypothetical protein
VYDGSRNYTNPFDRGSLFIGEFIIACNARYLVKAFSTANEYLFSVPPGYHGMDVPYTYFTSSNDAVSNNTLAQILQRYITNFAKTGDPNANSAPNFPKYANGITQNLNLTFINQVSLCYTPFDISAMNQSLNLTLFLLYRLRIQKRTADATGGNKLTTDRKCHDNHVCLISRGEDTRDVVGY